MMLAGLPVPERLVLILARKLRDAGLDLTAQRLETAGNAKRKSSHSTYPSATTSSKCSRTVRPDSANSAPSSRGCQACPGRV